MKRNNIQVRHRAYNPFKGQHYANHKGRLLFMTLMAIVGILSFLQILQDPTCAAGVGGAGVSMAALVALATSMMSPTETPMAQPSPTSWVSYTSASSTAPRRSHSRIRTVWSRRFRSSRRRPSTSSRRMTSQHSCQPRRKAISPPRVRTTS